MIPLLLIAVGGAFGALSRYMLSFFIQKQINSFFPAGTLTVNAVGCFLIGYGYSFFSQRLLSPSIKMMILVGFIGAFTTFSTFFLDLFHLVQNRDWSQAMLYFFLSHLCGGVMLIFGLYLGSY